ncbi:MAG: hypothetical protein FWG68_07695, partial [Defluviitaleaceae bacterium]|nr:hypothetical protein [Defluviitaleaceae bacterium]
MNFFDKLFSKRGESAVDKTSKTVSDGVAIQAFGRYFAGLMNMRMYDNYKIYDDYAEEPFKIWGVSPFSISGIADPYLQQYAAAKRTNTRVKADIRKNFGEICQKSHCDYFVVDNTPALIGLTEINTQLYSLMGGEKTDFMDDYFNNNAEIKANYIRPEEEGFSKRLKSQYDKFIGTILQHYDSKQILLVRSHIQLFDFNVRTRKIYRTNNSVKKRQFVEQLDNYFIKKTGCQVIDTAMRFFSYDFAPAKWDLKVALERDTISAASGNITGVAASYSGGG